MPAPKQFKPGPQATQGRMSSPPIVTKGRYAVVAPSTPIVDDPAVVEVSVDDITVVMSGSSKYEQRSFHAYGDTEASVGEEEVPEAEADPAPSHHTSLGEWTSESSLEGTRYRRKESRLS